MVQASRGPRRKTRNLFRKSPRQRGIGPITPEFQEFESGEKVNIIINPSVHHGMPHSRFHGLTGTVAGNQGRAFVVKVKQGNKLKTVVAMAEHLKRAG